MQLLYNTQEEGGKSIPARIWGYIRERRSQISRLCEMTLIAAIFFGLGMVYAWDIAGKRAPIRVIEPRTENSVAFVAGAIPAEAPQIKVPAPSTQKGEYVASKNGTKYYPKGCSNRIKEENKIYFSTKEDAEKAGFSIAKNCTQ